MTDGCRSPDGRAGESGRHDARQIKRITNPRA